MHFIELPRPLILASQSPRRAQLLRQVGFEFDVVPADINETSDGNVAPQELAVRLAVQKAQAVASRISNGFVVGADTIVTLDGTVLGKPQTREEAHAMLRFLSGRTHRVFTGFAIVVRPEGYVLRDWEQTAVTFRPLDDWEIERYVEIDRPFDKAGAYGIQDTSALFVESIEGCYYNVVGFPLTRFYVQLRKLIENMKKDNPL